MWYIYKKLIVYSNPWGREYTSKRNAPDEKYEMN
jgi:hypothetical protein